MAEKLVTDEMVKKAALAFREARTWSLVDTWNVGLLPSAMEAALRAVAPLIVERGAQVAEQTAKVMEDQRDNFLAEGPPNTRPALIRARQAQTATEIAAAIRELATETAIRPSKCEECGIYPADSPSRLCPGCEAYREHQQ